MIRRGDEEDALTRLLDLTADIVSQQSAQGFISSLLNQTQMGQWTPAEQLARQSGLDLNGIGPELFVAWLDDVSGDRDYALILFYDDETKLSAAAQYNRSIVAIERS